MIGPKTEYLLQRANAEAKLAGNAPHIKVATAHHQLSALYLSMAVVELAEDVAKRYFSQARRNASPDF